MFLGVMGFDDAPQSPAGRKLSCDRGRDGATGFGEICQDPVHRIFIKDAQVPVGVNVHFEGFEFQT